MPYLPGNPTTELADPLWTHKSWRFWNWTLWLLFLFPPGFWVPWTCSLVALWWCWFSWALCGCHTTRMSSASWRSSTQPRLSWPSCCLATSWSPTWEMSWCSCLGSRFLSSVSVCSLLWGAGGVWPELSQPRLQSLSQLLTLLSVFKWSQSRTGGGDTKQHKPSLMLLLNGYLWLLQQSLIHHHLPVMSRCWDVF